MDIEKIELPVWERLPDLELYMDQLLGLVARYMPAGGDDKGLTAAMVNNYVKQKILPPPVKKRYQRSHLAALLMICAMKSVLPIASIQRLFASAGEDEGIARLYDDFCREYNAPGVQPENELSTAQQIVRAALVSRSAQARALELLELLD